jgi:DNA-directed RNA polymerase specialized sigma24 family protein
LRNLFLHGLRSNKGMVPLNENTRDPQPGPLADAENKAYYEAVMARLRGLLEIDRAALLMSVVEEMTSDEIARFLGISVPAVKWKCTVLGYG